MTLLIPFLTAVLVTIAAIHILWGIGFWVPIRDEAALVRAVIGEPGRTEMPGAVACSLVAVALLGAASVLWWDAGLLRNAAVLAVGGVFVLRGIAAQLPAWWRRLPVEPFATLDRRVYGPLCLAIGGGFWVSLI